MRIQRDGYPATVHKVVTADGYVLHLHRIANDTPSGRDKKRTPVFLMHGLLETANSWIALGPRHSLGKTRVRMNKEEEKKQVVQVFERRFANFLFFDDFMVFFVCLLNKCEFSH